MHVAGGKAVAAVHSAEDGDAIVKVALEKFGGVHVLVANAGVLRDKSFQAMTEQEWDLVLAVHLRYVFPRALLSLALLIGLCAEAHLRSIIVIHDNSCSNYLNSVQKRSGRFSKNRHMAAS